MKTRILPLPILLLLTLLLSARPPGRSATAAPTGPNYLLQPILHAEGFDEPISMAHAGDARLFVIERDGRIWILDQFGQRLPGPFLDINDRVDSASGEQGLLGLAFHPEYAQNGFFYVNYTSDAGDGDTRISRFSRDPNDPNLADPDSEVVLLTVGQPEDIHNGGDMHFGPDGYLYIALGDGGGISGFSNPQNGNSLLGKILRIDVYGDFPYDIPADNPYVDNPAVRDEIYLMGLRNPWRFTVDPATGDIFIGNVGGAWYEEIDYFPAGTSPTTFNSGWPCHEGMLAYKLEYCDPPITFTPPLGGFDNPAQGCAVVGGHVYRGGEYPQMTGHYFFADLCLGNIWRLRPAGDGSWRQEHLMPGQFTLSAFGQDNHGELYVSSLTEGSIYRLQAISTQPHFLPAVSR